MKQLKLNLEGSKVSLRTLRLSDAWDVYTGIRNKEVGKWSGPDVCPRIENAFIGFACRLLRHLCKGLQLFCQALYLPKNPKVFRLGIVLRETRRVIGIITLSRSKSQPQCAEIGFWIGKKYWGRGLATEAVQLVLRLGFNNLGLGKIEAWTFEKNVGSIKVMEKCDFKLDGVVEAAYLKYGEMQNRLNYRILKSEYENVSG
jgi:RimJ/RimL family protein N-acetyltransferase